MSRRLWRRDVLRLVGVVLVGTVDVVVEAEPPAMTSHGWRESFDDLRDATLLLTG